MQLSTQSSSISVYIHWPFCKSKCPYCDFNSHVRDSVDERAWQNALLAEIDSYRHLLAGKKIESVFFGGGTPSLMHPETVGAVLEKIKYFSNTEASHPDESRDPVDKEIWIPAYAGMTEITLEANPTSSEASKFMAFRDAGINRLSMGVQSLNNQTLKFLGRQHSVEESLEAFAAAKEIFSRTSFDLIYANPDQRISDWQAELGRALQYASGHMSLYQLTIEPGTVFNIMHKDGRLVLPAEDLAEEFYNVTQDIMSDAGYAAYEVSNHAKPEHECRHNLTYWRSGDFIGIGPGAHGRFSFGGERFATVNIKSPERWLRAVQEKGFGVEDKTTLTPQEQGEEILLMGLRLNEGVNAVLFKQRSGIDLMTAIEQFVDGGFIKQSGDYIVATQKGRLLLNTLVAEIVKKLWP